MSVGCVEGGVLSVSRVRARLCLLWPGGGVGGGDCDGLTDVRVGCVLSVASERFGGPYVLVVAARAFQRSGVDRARSGPLWNRVTARVERRQQLGR